MSPEVIVERTTPAGYGVPARGWNPIQLLPFLSGLALVVMGGVALARTGFDDGMTGIEVAAGWLHHTPVLALIHLVFGLALMIAGAVRAVDRGVLAFLGSVALVFGAIVFIEPDGMHGTLATHPSHGATYIVIGVLTLLAAVVLGWLRRRVVVA